MSWLYYLLEANLYLIAFYCFYRLFLHQETFYNSNRYFLLLSSLTAFILPILQLGFLKPTLIVDNIDFPPPILYIEGDLQATAIQVQKTISFTDYLYLIYLFIAFCFVLKLSINLYKITCLWLKAKKTNTGEVTVIELNEEIAAFSFFNLLFIHPNLTEKQTVLKHEMVHIKQRHSFDIIFFELVQIVCWFNPILYFIKKDIKLLHEYIADELTTNTDVQKHEYALFLIQNSFGMNRQPIANQIFNQSILKRRINMLNKKRTAARARLRLLLILPLVGAMLCTSTMAFTKDYGYVDLLPEKSELAAIQENPKVENIKKNNAPKVENIKKQQKDQVKFPPPKISKIYLPKLEYDSLSKKQVSTEKKLIIINNKPITNNREFYGVAGADQIIHLNSANAIKKYGEAGKNGAVEIIGKNVKDAFPPPIVRDDKIKFPPPVVKPDRKGQFYPRYGKDKTSGEVVLKEKRYILVNEVPVTNLTTFYGVSNAGRVNFLNSKVAIAKYGDKARYGAVEITGKNINYFTKRTFPTPPAVEPPPPGYKKDQVKFPPPVVKPDKKKIVEGEPLRPKSTEGQVKFPAPIRKKENTPSATVTKNVIIYGDPIPNKKTDTIKIIEGDPIRTIEIRPTKQ